MYIGSFLIAGGSVAAIHEQHSVGYDTVLEVVCSRLWTLPGTTTCIHLLEPILVEFAYMYVQLIGVWSTPYWKLQIHCVGVTVIIIQVLLESWL